MFRLHLISSSILHPKKQVVSNAWIMFVKDVMVRCLWEQGVTIPKFPPTKKHKGKEENSTARFSTKKLLKGKHLQPNLNDIWHRGISKPPGGFNIQHGWKHQFHPPSLPPRCSRIEQDAELKGPDAQNEGTDGPATMRRKVLSNSSFLWVMFIIHDRAATYLISHEPKQKTYHYPYYPGEWQDFRPNMTCVYMHSRTYKCAGHSDANSPKADAQNDPNLLLLRYIYIYVDIAFFPNQDLQNKQIHLKPAGDTFLHGGVFLGDPLILPSPAAPSVEHTKKSTRHLDPENSRRVSKFH